MEHQELRPQPAGGVRFRQGPAPSRALEQKRLEPDRPGQIAAGHGRRAGNPEIPHTDLRTEFETISKACIGSSPESFLMKITNIGFFSRALAKKVDKPPVSRGTRLVVITRAADSCTSM